MNKEDVTIIICCAGMGTRLGIGSTKALINVCGEPLIGHQLKLLKDYDDVRIVVGYQAEKVITTVNNYRKDIMFAFNYDYENTGVAASLSKGLIGARKYVIYMDGDLLANKDDFRTFLQYQGECLAVSQINSDEPLLMNIYNGLAVSFSNNGSYSWPGLAKIEANKLKYMDTHVYEMIKPLLPLTVINVRSREIDTEDDYERAVIWMENGCID